MSVCVCVRDKKIAAFGGVCVVVVFWCHIERKKETFNLHCWWRWQCCCGAVVGGDAASSTCHIASVVIHFLWAAFHTFNKKIKQSTTLLLCKRKNDETFNLHLCGSNAMQQQWSDVTGCWLVAVLAGRHPEVAAATSCTKKEQSTCAALALFFNHALNDIVCPIVHCASWLHLAHWLQDFWGKGKQYNLTATICQVDWHAAVDDIGVLSNAVVVGIMLLCFCSCCCLEVAHCFFCCCWWWLHAFLLLLLDVEALLCFCWCCCWWQHPAAFVAVACWWQHCPAFVVADANGILLSLLLLAASCCFCLVVMVVTAHCLYFCYCWWQHCASFVFAAIGGLVAFSGFRNSVRGSGNGSKSESESCFCCHCCHHVFVAVVVVMSLLPFCCCCHYLAFVFFCPVWPKNEFDFST